VRHRVRNWLFLKGPLKLGRFRLGGEHRAPLSKIRCDWERDKKAQIPCRDFVHADVADESGRDYRQSRSDAQAEHSLPRISTIRLVVH
jgi:hypothetical protein